MGELFKLLIDGTVFGLFVYFLPHATNYWYSSHVYMFFLFFYIIIKLDIFLCFKNIFCSLSENIFCSSNLILLYFDLTYLIFTILFYISISFFISLLIRKTSRPASTSLIISCLTVSLFKKSLSEKPINEVVSVIKWLNG